MSHPAIAGLASRPPAVLATGVILRTRVRLARNIDGLPFKAKLGEQQARAVLETMGPRLQRVLGDDSTLVDLAACSSVERQVLVERHLISPELATTARPAACIISNDERTSLMLGEEDHVRLQTLHPGSDLLGTLDRCVSLDQRLEQEITWAFHERFGYLTSCPSNLGTGLRASVMLHLPALVRSSAIRTVLRGLERLRIAVRGVYGEGSEAIGAIFQISNQRSLGMSEEDIVSGLEEAAHAIVDQELMERDRLLRQQNPELEDLVQRSIGLLRHARLLQAEETAEHFSNLRLGLVCGLLPRRLAEELPHRELACRNGHLQLLYPEQAADAAGRHRLRAHILRQWVAEWV